MGKVEKIEVIEYVKGSELFARTKKKGEKKFGNEINLKGGKEWTKETKNLQDMQDIEEQ